MIVVTGANGQLGRKIVERMLDRTPADQVGVSVREPEQAAALAERGVRVRRGDFDDPQTLAQSFDGASGVVIVSVGRSTEASVQAHRAAIGAAQAAGVERIFYTSHAGSDPISPFPPMICHAVTEIALRESGLAFTSLRNGFYPTTMTMLVADAVTTGELRAPEDGPVNWTTHDDLAEATAIALTVDRVTDPILNLTGAEAVDLAGVAAIASELTGRDIRRVVITDADHRADLVARGVPEQAADLLVGLFVASRQRRFTLIDPTLARLIGRPPLSVRDMVRQAIAE